MNATRRLYSSGSLVSTRADTESVGGRFIPFFRTASLLKNSLEDLRMSLNMTEAELFLPLSKSPTGVPMAERRFRMEPKRLLGRFSGSPVTASAAFCTSPALWSDLFHRCQDFTSIWRVANLHELSRHSLGCQQASAASSHPSSSQSGWCAAY